jgi:exonuclease SbcC
MRLETFSLQGMLRFGETCAVDLRDVPAGLIAVVGENGAGKTSLMETPLAALYRSFPSRADREIVDYATGRDSHLEATFAVDGRGLYRARVNLDGVRRSAEAVLVHETADGAAVLNDGKVTTYDQVIRETFQAPDVLLASAFSAQNRAGSFATLDRKGRKALFAQLLGLEHYETMAQTARQAAQQLETTLGRVQVEREVLARGAGSDADEVMAAARCALDASQEAARRDRDRTADELQRAAAAVARCADQVARHRAAVDRHAAGRVGLQRAERALSDARQERANADTDHAATVAIATRAHEAAVRDIDSRLAKNRGVLHQAEQIRAAEAESEKLRDRLQMLRATERATAADIQQLAQATTASDAAVREVDTAELELRRLTIQADTLASVPCGGEGEFGGCRFLALARQAAAELPAVRAVVETKAARASKATAAHLAKRLAEDGLAITQQEIDAVSHRLDALRPFLQLAQPLAAAEARIVELEQQRALQLDAFAEDQIVTRDVHARLVGKLDAALDVARANVVAAQQDVERVDREVDETAQAQAQMADAVTARDVLQRQHTAAMAALARLEAERQALDERASRLAAVRAQLAELDVRAEGLRTELLDWRFLAKALGRDGLPVLEIDGAGPTVSSYTNSLLTACFGGRFSVQLVTQEAKADGKGAKETFELKVFDAERGGQARDLTDLSGGEQILVEEALKNALAIFANQRSATPIQTCWRDETTGALDGENATRYLAMLRKVREIGGFHHVIFVTHNRDAAMSADAQIVVHDGQADVVEPPYCDREAA